MSEIFFGYPLRNIMEINDTPFGFVYTLVKLILNDVAGFLRLLFVSKVHTSDVYYSVMPSLLGSHWTNGVGFNKRY